MTRALRSSPAGRTRLSTTLPPGNGRSVYAGVWLVPLTVAAAILVGFVLRWWVL